MEPGVLAIQCVALKDKPTHLRCFEVYADQDAYSRHLVSPGISRLTVKKILNHAERDVTAIYDRHSYDPEKRSALDAWARRLDAIVSHKPTKSQVPELSTAPPQAVRS